MNESYIIAFTQGSSGRFVKHLLGNLLADWYDELITCPITNSTHNSDHRRYTGCSSIPDVIGLEKIGFSHPEIWNRFNFDDPLLEPGAPKIFATHRFPDFKLIQDRLGPNVKIIIITIDPHDVKEVVANDKLKNYYDILTGTSRDVQDPYIVKELLNRYERFLGKRYPGTFVKEDIIGIAKGLALEHLAHFLNKELYNIDNDTDGEERIRRYMVLPKDIDYPLDQILFLPYSEIADQINDEYTWLKKLEDFTGKTANAATKKSYQNYLYRRTKLIKEYRF